MPRDDAETRRRRRAQVRKYHLDGLSNRAIGRLLGITHTTVALYLERKVVHKTTPALEQKTTPVSAPPDWWAEIENQPPKTPENVT